METVADAQALILRGLGWQEHVVGEAGKGQTRGWLPPGDHAGGGAQVVALDTTTLPPGTWSAKRALELVLLDSFGPLAAYHFDARPAELDIENNLVASVRAVGLEPKEPTRSVARYTLLIRDLNYQNRIDVEWSVSATHFPSMWSAWAGRVLASAPGERRPASDLARERARLVPEVEEEIGAAAEQAWRELEAEPVVVTGTLDGPWGMQSALAGLAERAEMAQEILVQGGKGAKRRALELLGFRV